MSWRDDLQRVTLPDGRRVIGASFRGVTFFVRSSERSGGRRGVTHEFPLRDDPAVEDLGRKARVFPVEGYVLGDDYIAERNALQTALEDESGPGTLVHPYHGIRRAICFGFTVRESIDDGRIATFQIEFNEAPADVLAPTDAPDLPEQVEVATDAAITATSDELVTTYDVEDQPSFALESLSLELTNLADKLEAELEGIVSSTQELAKLKQEIEIITAQASSLIRAPATAISTFAETIQALVETAIDAPKALVDALVATYGLDSVPLALPISATRVLEAANQTALAAALRRVLVSEAARVLPRAEFATLEDALAARDSVIDLIDEQLLTATDESFPELQTLRSSLVLAVPGDQDLDRILALEQRSTIASILLTYRLYGNLDLESDVIARNRVRHPGFIAGDLSVLSG